jgi:tetratricopeptide (TPR) repeat protein
MCFKPITNYWRWLPIALLFLLPPQAKASDDTVSEPIKERIRAEAPFPKLPISVEYSLTTNGFVDETEPQPSPQKNLIEFLAKPEPVKKELLLAHKEELAKLYGALGKKQTSKATWQEVETLYRERIQESPEDKWRYLLRLHDIGYVLEWTPKQHEDILREAVKLAPREWEPWARLGSFLAGNKYAVVISPSFVFDPAKGAEQVLQEIAESSPTTEQITQIEVLDKEARICLDKAIELAPDKAIPYAYRGASNMMNYLLDGLRAKRDGKAFDVSSAMAASMLGKNVLADFDNVTRRDANNPVALAANGFYKIAAAIKETNGKDPKDEGLRSFPPALQAEISSLLKQLAAIGEDKSRTELDRVHALEGAVTLNIMVGEDAEAERFARAATKVSPERERSFLMWISALAKTKQRAIAIEALEARLKQTLPQDDSNTLLIYLARLHGEMGKLTEAETAYRQVLAKEPGQLNATLGVAIVHLKQSGTDKDAMTEAKVMLSKINEERASGLQGEDWINTVLTFGVFAALSDEKKQAVEYLSQIKEAYAYNEDAVRLLAILEEK